MQHIHIGTSGWSHPQWKPALYPPGAKAGDWLAHYARVFNSVELNSSFYRPPSLISVARWRDAVPEDFRFAVKAWREITHTRKLRDCAAALRQMFEMADAFGGKAGVMLFQLPPSFARDDALLAAFLAQLTGEMRYAFEFRHPSWFTKPVYALLEQRGIALASSHMRGWTPMDSAPPFLYARLHGPDRLYHGSYDAAFLSALAEHLRAGGKDAYIYFNNTIGGPAAIDNARALMGLCV